LVEFEQAYEQAESDAYTNFNHKFVVEKAEIADKKHQPKRLVIMLLATFSTFFFAVLAVLVYERFKEIKAIQSVE
jgi:tyrosine-protein kinase Etk/Wzc